MIGVACWDGEVGILKLNVRTCFTWGKNTSGPRCYLGRRSDGHLTGGRDAGASPRMPESPGEAGLWPLSGEQGGPVGSCGRRTKILVLNQSQGKAAQKWSSATLKRFGISQQVKHETDGPNHPASPGPGVHPHTDWQVRVRSGQKAEPPTRPSTEKHLKNGLHPHNATWFHPFVHSFIL